MKDDIANDGQVANLNDFIGGANNKVGSNASELEALKKELEKAKKELEKEKREAEKARLELEKERLEVEKKSIITKKAYDRIAANEALQHIFSDKNIDNTTTTQVSMNMATKEYFRNYIKAKGFDGYANFFENLSLYLVSEEINIEPIYSLGKYIKEKGDKGVAI
jgi:chromosome condensin MukBEF ATPase and DNA-binding subunit MukB